MVSDAESVVMSPQELGEYDDDVEVKPQDGGSEDLGARMDNP